MFKNKYGTKTYIIKRLGAFANSSGSELLICYYPIIYIPSFQKTFSNYQGLNTLLITLIISPPLHVLN